MSGLVGVDVAVGAGIVGAAVAGMGVGRVAASIAAGAAVAGVAAAQTAQASSAVETADTPCWRPAGGCRPARWTCSAGVRIRALLPDLASSCHCRHSGGVAGG